MISIYLIDSYSSNNCIDNPTWKRSDFILSKDYSSDMERFLVEIRKRMRAHGFFSPYDLLFCSKSRSEKLFPDQSEALSLQKILLKDLHPKRGSELAARGLTRQTIATGLKKLDRVLGEGVKTGRIISFYGISGSGKTQLCFQLSINVQLSRSKGGVEGSCLFIDTVETFRPERIAEMAEARGLDVDKILGHIYCQSPKNVGEQLNLAQSIPILAAKKDVRLVIIDTLTENFFFNYYGESGLIQRQSLIASHIHTLTDLALKYDLALVVTNPVRARLSVGRVGLIAEAGGPTVAGSAYKKILLEKEDHLRSATLIDPLCRAEKIYFRIEDCGVVDA